jgi:hypothetical protein
MNLSEPAMLVAALFHLIAGCWAGLAWAKIRGRRSATAPVPTCLADQEICSDLDTCRVLIDQFDQALWRCLEEVADGGHDEGALVLLSVLQRAGISRDRLDDLIDTLAWLAVYNDLHGDHGPEQPRRERGLARLAARCSRTVGRRHAPGAPIAE